METIALTEQQLAALKSYAFTFGRTWKSKLNTAWCNGTDAYEAKRPPTSPGAQPVRTFLAS